jgi:RNA polymerase sigma-70 factor, ECF subfamily
MNDPHSDEALIAHARNGDMKAFKSLVERYEGKIAGVIKPMLGDIPQAVDVGQEVFIRFYESLGNFRGESSLGTYLIRIAINLSLNEIKRKKRNENIFRPLESGHHVEGNESSSDLHETLYDEINKLEPDFRIVVTLRMIEGYSTEETSNMLNIPQGTVLSRLSRAQNKLRDVLSKKQEQ